MPSIQRPLSGSPLVFRISEEKAQVGDAATFERHGRRARTLVKDGPLRVTLIELAPGGGMAEHRAPGPITVQPLSGRIHFAVEGKEHELGVGDFLALEKGVPHSVSSTSGGAFLLTVSRPDQPGVD